MEGPYWGKIVNSCLILPDILQWTLPKTGLMLLKCYSCPHQWVVVVKRNQEVDIENIKLTSKGWFQLNWIWCVLKPYKEEGWDLILGMHLDVLIWNKKKQGYDACVFQNMTDHMALF